MRAWGVLRKAASEDAVVEFLLATEAKEGAASLPVWRWPAPISWQALHQSLATPSPAPTSWAWAGQMAKSRTAMTASPERRIGIGNRL